MELNRRLVEARGEECSFSPGLEKRVLKSKKNIENNKDKKDKIVKQLPVFLITFANQAYNNGNKRTGNAFVQHYLKRNNIKIKI